MRKTVIILSVLICGVASADPCQPLANETAKAAHSYAVADASEKAKNAQEQKALTVYAITQLRRDLALYEMAKARRKFSTLKKELAYETFAGTEDAWNACASKHSD